MLDVYLPRITEPCRCSSLPRCACEFERENGTGIRRKTTNDGKKRGRNPYSIVIRTNPDSQRISSIEDYIPHATVKVKSRSLSASEHNEFYRTVLVECFWWVTVVDTRLRSSWSIWEITYIVLRRIRYLWLFKRKLDLSQLDLSLRI